MRAHVLLAEHDGALRSRLMTALEADGFTVAGSNTSDEVVSAFEEASPDLIVLDMALPGADAWTTLERAQAFAPLPPVLLLSERGGNPRYGPLSEAVAACLFKPVRAAEVVGACRRILDFHASHRRARERRKEDRSTVVAEVAVGPEGEASLTGRLTNLSRSGFQVEIPALLHGLDRLRITVRVPGAAPVTFLGRVYWRRPTDEGFLVGGDITSFTLGSEDGLRALLHPGS